MTSNREQCKSYLKTYNSSSKPRQSYRHTTDSTHSLSSLVAFSLYYGRRQWMFYLSLCTDADRGKSHNLLKLYQKTLYEGKYEVWSCISSREFFSSSRIGALPMLFTIFLHSFSEWIILPTKSVLWASFLIDNVNDIFYLFSCEFRCLQIVQNSES